MAGQHMENALSEQSESKGAFARARSIASYGAMAPTQG